MSSTVVSQYNLGIIGCSKRARNMARRLVRRQPDMTITGLFDPSEKSVKATRKFLEEDIAAYESLEAFLADPDMKWVMIGSPNALHRPQAIAALAAGKHVFCEKPLATTLEDCIAMTQALGKTDRHFVFGCTLRFRPFYRAIRKLLDEGVIGELISFEFNETLDWNHGGYIHRDWRRKRSMAGTHLLEKCCHDVDLANWFVGARASRVASFGGLRFFTAANKHFADRLGPNPENSAKAYQSWRIETETDIDSPFNDDKDIIDHQVAILEFDNGVRGTFHTNCNGAIPERRFYMMGTEGTLRGNVISGELEFQRIGWNTERVSVDPGAKGGHGGGDEILVDELAATVRGEAYTGPGLAEGLASAITCFAIDQAMDEGRVVDLAEYWQQADAALA